MIDVIGTPLTATTYEEFARHCQVLSQRDHTSAVDLSNTHVVTLRRHELEFRELTSQFDFFLPDGMPLIWCLNRKGADLHDRVYGPTFMRHCILSSSVSYKHYLLGGSPECLTQLRSRLLQQQPALQIVGSHHGYFQSDEEENLLAEINRLSPDFIWIGLGTPRQQQWIYRYKSRIKRGVLFAVGFAFDVNAGTKPDAPRWMQRHGLTWIFRMASEPRRLLRRYLRYNTLFLFYLMKDTIFPRRTEGAGNKKLSPAEIERVNVLGVGISVLDQEKAREFLFDTVRQGRRGYVTVTGVHGVSEAQSDDSLRDIFDRALLVTPDGMPMVWMGRLQGHSSIKRVYGPDLMLNLCEHSVGAGFTHFLYGGVPGIAEELQRNLERRFPGIKIVGTYTPPFRRLNDKELGDLQQQVRWSRPDFFWVGLSTPKQERFMAQHLSILPEVKIFIGVGAAFDLVSGRIRQAPLWMQRSGLEWFFRLLQEPRRLAWRYLANNPRFVFLVLRQFWRQKKA